MKKLAKGILALALTGVSALSLVGCAGTDNSALAELETRITALETELSSEKATTSVLTAQVGEQQTSISALTSQNTELNGKVDELTTANTELNGKVDELTNMNTELNGRVDELTAENEELKAQIKDEEEESGYWGAYSLEQAYENGWLTTEDLKEISRRYNALIYKNVNLTPEELEDTIDGKTEEELKASFCHYVQGRAESLSADGISLAGYFGSYGDTVAAKFVHERLIVEINSYWRIDKVIGGVLFKDYNANDIPVWHRVGDAKVADVAIDEVEDLYGYIDARINDRSYVVDHLILQIKQEYAFDSTWHFNFTDLKLNYQIRDTDYWKESDHSYILLDFTRERLILTEVETYMENMVKLENYIDHINGLNLPYVQSVFLEPYVESGLHG